MKNILIIGLLSVIGLNIVAQDQSLFIRDKKPFTPFDHYQMSLGATAKNLFEVKTELDKNENEKKQALFNKAILWYFVILDDKWKFYVWGKTNCAQLTEKQKELWNKIAPEMQNAKEPKIEDLTSMSVEEMVQNAKNEREKHLINKAQWDDKSLPSK